VKSPICVANNAQNGFFRILGLMLAIMPLWLMLAAGNTSAQTSSSTPSPSDWTQFLRNNMQRWNPYETVVDANNAANLQLKWSAATNGALFGVNDSSPAVVNGVVYVGSGNGSVYALNASSGAVLWSFATGAFVASSPAVVNGVVYVGALARFGDGGMFYALNASTGAQLWSFVTDNPVTSSPAVVNGVVYVGSSNGNVYALNASTGAQLWSFVTGNTASAYVPQATSSPAVVNGVVYIGGTIDDNLYALNASTGALLWKYATGGDVESSPAVVNGVVYIGSLDHNLYALNASTGTKLWSFSAQLPVASTPAVANGIVYVGSENGTVYAVNANTGTRVWSYTTVETVNGSPAVANGVVYIGDENGNLYALNASDGAKLWSHPFGGIEEVTSSPVVVDGVVYGSTGDHLYAFWLGVGADLYLRIIPTPTTVHQGDLVTYAFPVWNLGPDSADLEVLNTQVPAGTTFDYIRISGTPGLGTCTTPPYQGTGQIVCHENSAMAVNTTWTVRLTVKVTAPAGTVITENAATMATTPDTNMANNTATVSLTVQ
jgi:outer membrane protein assembly factor BamB